jgi:DNA polymerase
VSSPGTETTKLLAWLESENVWLPDVKKETVALWLGKNIPPKVKRVLEIRQLVAKASVAKIERMVDWSSSHDGRARNGLQFYGAGRTGRWAGRGIQVQNLPRIPKGFRPDDVIKVAAADFTALGLLYENPMAAISKSLRALLVARPGHVLVSIDLSQIEARVLAWLARQTDVLEAFAGGRDIYTETAARHGSVNRQLGKVLVLACGFGMGAAKFKDTAEKDYGVKLTLAEAETALRAWRQDNSRIVGFWYDLQRTVEQSVANPGSVAVTVAGGKNLMVRTRDGVTQIRKPNGVKLTYHNMRLENGGLVFDGLNSVTKKWGTERTYGGRLVENLVQSVARDVMAEAMLAAPLRPVMSVHDEIVWEVEDIMVKVMTDALQAVVDAVPSWAGGLPIASEIKISRRYGGS